MSKSKTPRAGVYNQKVGDRTPEERQRTFQENRADIQWRQEQTDKRVEAFRKRRSQRGSGGSGGINITVDKGK